MQRRVLSFFAARRLGTLLSWGAGVGLLLSTSLAGAAVRTDVADAVDTIVIGDTERDDPFDLYIGSSFEFAFHWGKITREPINLQGRTISGCDAADSRLCLPVYELAWSRNYQLMNIYGEIGIFHDLSTTVRMPITFNDKIEFAYADGVDAGVSSVDRGVGVNGTIFPANTVGARSGPGALEWGFRWAPLSDERDDSKPMWVIYGHWAIPYTAETYYPDAGEATANDRVQPASADDPAPMGDGVHRLKVGLAFSRRIGNFGLIGISNQEDRRGYIDPYFDLSFTAPFPTSSHSPEALVIIDEVLPSGNGSYFGSAPSYLGEFAAGFEVVPYESLRGGHKISIDIGFRGSFYTNGRNYSELSIPLNELTYTEQYFLMGGEIGIIADIATYVRFTLGFRIQYGSEHFLTMETAGEDRDGNNRVDDPADGPTDDIRNPYYCGYTDSDTCSTAGVASYDQIGYRFKSEEQVVATILTSLLITF